MKSCKKIPLVCPICKSKQNCGDAIKEHLRIDCKKAIITCNECNKEFERNRFYSGHECPKKYQDYKKVIDQ